MNTEELRETWFNNTIGFFLDYLRTLSRVRRLYRPMKMDTNDM